MKQFRLFKRDPQGREMDPAAPGYKDRPYWFRFQFRNQSYPRSLETNDATEAQRLARLRYREITTAVIRGESTRLDAPAPVGTLEQLYAAYRVGPSEANANTREMNILALQAIAGDATTIDQLTPQRVRQSFAAVSARLLELTDQEKIASLKRSANSRWSKASSLFTPRCLAHYLDQQLIPSTAALVDFVNAGNLAEFTRIPKVAYNPPNEKILAATMAAWEALTDRDLFLVIGHELSFGLRIAEMAQARWAWHQVRNNYPVLDSTAHVKNGTGQLRVRALDPWYTTMIQRIQLKKWRTADDDLIIQGPDAYRLDAIFRSVSDFLRNLGWATKKTNHALRAYAGSQVAMKYGIYEAQSFLRHSTVKVTEQHYTHFVDDFKPADLDTIPARWAVAQPIEFVPKILEASA